MSNNDKSSLNRFRILHLSMPIDKHIQNTSNIIIDCKLNIEKEKTIMSLVMIKLLLKYLLFFLGCALFLSTMEIMRKSAF